MEKKTKLQRQRLEKVFEVVIKAFGSYEALIDEVAKDPDSRVAVNNLHDKCEYIMEKIHSELWDIYDGEQSRAFGGVKKLLEDDLQFFRQK